CLVAFVSLRADNSGLQRFLLNLSMLYILVLLFFWKFPIFHDRIKYFVFMPIFYLFWMVLDKSRYGNRLVYGGVFAIISLSVLCYEVTGSMFYPYEPYYNIYEKWLGGGTNDGEDRTLRYYNHFDSQWQGGNK
ncbi:hypothetical protein, partial [Rahnella variigena]|uniref:hypothetical protein n=1 Tax=Rahnella variigena TaxID=574964 RepID=UPI001C707272